MPSSSRILIFALSSDVLVMSVASRRRLTSGDAQPDHAPDRFQNDGEGDLGASKVAVPENDGDFPNGKLPGAIQPVRGLDLKKVPIGKQLVQPDRAQGLPPPGFEAAGGVAKGHGGDYLHVETGALAQYQPLKIPVDHADAVQVSRAQHHIERLQLLHELREVRRVAQI